MDEEVYGTNHTHTHIYICNTVGPTTYDSEFLKIVYNYSTIVFRTLTLDTHVIIRDVSRSYNIQYLISFIFNQEYLSTI